MLGNASPHPGKVLVVATPIGNLDDLSPRARSALEQADLIACEDTRRTGRLLHGLGLKKRMLSMHDHNERQRLPQILSALEQGLVVAVVSDAGTPLLSDPGFPLIREAATRGVRIEPIPGPSAATTALVASALPPYPFTFAGFPPNRVKRRRAFFRKLGDLEHTFVVFESPHRLIQSLSDAHEELGDRSVAVCRELTKVYEEILRGSLGEVLTELKSRPSLKGEYVVVIGGS
ncbi:MAG: 16S rRNA (cytidine(1402)-2'-O)-methyltransferase [Thermoanaerobaculia bacterium]|nr:16S rRNA (cytidine(1402)-2'-O)-methyltransferase [Thermoanaerobaculia bacterium]